MRKCPYCSFFSIAGKGTQHESYVRAIKGQVQRIVASDWGEERQVATIFVGGGTPTILAPERLSDFLEQIRCRFTKVKADLETSIEVNPATVNYSDLAQLHRVGFNRISIGVQSLLEQELKDIGRPHSVGDALRTLADARRAGFSNLNIDLMYGLPGQTVASWERSLNRALQEKPDHLAIYELTIEEGTPFATQKRQGKLNLPTEDEVLDMMTVTAEMISRAGLYRYEISNYAKPGRECRHNVNYWRNGSYIGIGPGAVSSLSGRRYTAIADVDEYCQRISSGGDWWSDMEELNAEARFRETVVMGLRMTDGVSIEELFHRFKIDAVNYYGDTLLQLEQQNLVTIQGGRLRLSSKGMNLANQVMLQLV